MEHFDIIIRGGLIIDGSGREPFVADVCVRDGLIVRIGDCAAGADEQIDATGCIVTPGFVDIHTHYDGQAIWSRRLSPSSHHGVTTVVVGNCGVGFAPCRQEDHEILVSVMEGVEDIPEAVMAEGLPWSWETFPEYLDALEERQHDIDLAAYIPHSPLRVYVMGERGARREAATDRDIRAMKEIVAEALAAGAIGFSTSRLLLHRTGKGDFIPSYEADQQELLAIGEAMGAAQAGIFQVVVNAGEAYDREIGFLSEFATKTGRPVTFSLAQVNEDADGWRAALASVSAAAEQGCMITGQVFPRPVGVILGLNTSIHPFSSKPTYRASLADMVKADRLAAMRDPEIRTALLNETVGESVQPIHVLANQFERIYRLKSAADYEPQPGTSIAALARAAGVTPEAYAYDALLEDDGNSLLYAAIANYASGTLDAVLEMMRDPNVIVGLGDGGAHYGLICDASYPTFLLTHWTRDRNGDRLSVPEAVRFLTRRPAETAGLLDRGLLAEGYKADINVIAYDELQLDIPETIDDLPGGAVRLTQNCSGYRATIVSGEPILRNDEPTGRYPGKLIRGRKSAPVQQGVLV